MPRGSVTIGVDLGQVFDFTALAVVERMVRVKEYAFQPLVHEDHYFVRFIKRWELNTPYRAIIAQIGEMMRRDDNALKDAVIVLDGTGVGRAVCDLFLQAFRRNELGAYWPVVYVITGGREVTSQLVPKRELVGKLQTLLESDRLKVADALPEAELLRKELKAFRVKTTAAGNDTYEALRERDHDDIVLAVALACWYRNGHADPRGLRPEDSSEKLSVA